MLSMTGYGSGEAPLGGGRLVVEIRAVNHRFLDVRVRMPTEIAAQAQVAEDTARKELKRGRIEVSARIEGDAAGLPELDRARARAAFEQLCAMRDELRPEEPVPLSLLGTVPELFSSRGQPEGEELREALDAACRTACASLIAMRSKEGRALAADLRSRLITLETHIAAVRESCPQVVQTYRKKLHERIDRLLKDSTVAVDAGRLEQEVALFADKAEISEELTRLTSHCGQFRELIDGSSDTIGRRLDFLLQEMNRETNTVGSKCSDAAIARVVVELKAELERMREQVQNVL